MFEGHADGPFAGKAIEVRDRASNDAFRIAPADLCPAVIEGDIRASNGGMSRNGLEQAGHAQIAVTALPKPASFGRAGAINPAQTRGFCS